MDILKNGFRTGKAFVLKTNARGADLVIPVRAKLAPETFSFILIQVKNQADVWKEGNKRFQDAYGYFLTPSYVFEGSELEQFGDVYMGILWQTGQGKIPMEVIKVPRLSTLGHVDHRAALVGVYNSSHGGSELENLLSLLLDTKVNPLDDNWFVSTNVAIDKRKFAIESFAPFRTFE